MKKGSFLTIIALLVVCFAFSSFGYAKAMTVNSQMIGYPDAKITLTWLPQEGLDSPNKPVADYLRATVVAWVKKHPNVKIELTAQSVNIQNAMAKMLVQAAAGNAPDIAAVDSFILPDFWEYLQPLDDVLRAKKIAINSWFPFAQKLMRPKDKTLALWYDTDVRMFYYRKDLIQTPPKNWEELLALGKKMTNQGYVGFLIPAGRNETTSCDILPWFWSQGGKLVDNAGKPTFYDDSNKAYMLNTFSYIKQLIDGGITPTRISSYMTDGDMNSEIASGKVAMFVGGSWLVKQLEAVMGEKQFMDKWALAPIPMKAGGIRTTTSGGWTVGVFAKDETKRKLAADFAVTLFASDKGNAGYCEASGNLPCRKTIYDTAAFLKNDPIAQKFKEELVYATIRPGVRIYNVISQELQVALSEMITGAATPAKALENAWKNVKSQSESQN